MRGRRESPRSPVSGRTGSHRSPADSCPDSLWTSSPRRFDAACSSTAMRCLHSPSEFRRKSGQSQLPSSGSIRRSSVRYGRARPTAPRRVQTQPRAARPTDDLNLVRVSRRAAAKHRLESVSLDWPVAALRDRQDVPNDALRRHPGGPAMRTSEQDLISLTTDRDRVGHGPHSFSSSSIDFDDSSGVRPARCPSAPGIA